MMGLGFKGMAGRARGRRLSSVLETLTSHEKTKDQYGGSDVLSSLKTPPTNLVTHFGGIHMEIPEQDKIRMDHMVQKMCAEDKWQGRRIIATDEFLFFARISIPEALTSVEEGQQQGDGEKDAPKDVSFDTTYHVVDSIPLHEITKVRMGDDNTIEIATQQIGFNSGRPYVLRCTDMHDEMQNQAHVIKEELSALSYNAKWGRNPEKTVWRRRRLAVKKLYDHKNTQMLIAALICGNFIMNAYEKQLGIYETPEETRLYKWVEVGFTAVFTVELCVNMFSNWLKPFFNDGWNLFDLLVVIASLVSVFINEYEAETDLPGLSVLRLLRAFRVLRLFGRLGAQRKIIAALTASMVPVLHALMVVALIIAIYAILAVDFFGRKSIFFATFADAVFSMFQVATLDSWGDIVRGLWDYEDGSASHVDIGIFFFFGSYICMVSWTLLPVVVALLLDNFTAIAMAEKLRAEEENKEERRAVAHVLDPLLRKMVHFNTASDLSARIATLFQILDADESGGLTYQVLFEGFKKLQLSPGIHLSHEDYEIMTDNGRLCNSKGEMGVVEFEEMMRIMLRLYIERNVESAMRITSASDPAPESCAVLASLKLIMMEMEELRALTGMRAVNVRGRSGSFTAAEELHRMNVEVKLERASHHIRRSSLLDQTRDFTKGLVLGGKVKASPTGALSHLNEGGAERTRSNPSREGSMTRRRGGSRDNSRRGSQSPMGSPLNSFMNLFKGTAASQNPPDGDAGAGTTMAWARGTRRSSARAEGGTSSKPLGGDILSLAGDNRADSPADLTLYPFLMAQEDSHTQARSEAYQVANIPPPDVDAAGAMGNLMSPPRLHRRHNVISSPTHQVNDHAIISAVDSNSHGDHDKMDAADINNANTSDTAKGYEGDKMQSCSDSAVPGAPHPHVDSELGIMHGIVIPPAAADTRHTPADCSARPQHARGAEAPQDTSSQRTHTVAYPPALRGDWLSDAQRWRRQDAIPHPSGATGGGAEGQHGGSGREEATAGRADAGGLLASGGSGLLASGGSGRGASSTEQWLLSASMRVGSNRQGILRAARIKSSAD